MTTPDPVIELDNVSFSYDTEPILNEVDLTLEQGAFLAIIGPNGGGKTTLIKLMLGLLTPQSGTVRIFGKDPARTMPCVGYVPQHQSFERGFPITVLDVVLLGLDRSHSRRLGFSRRFKHKAMDALAKVEMTRYASRRIDELSGGQRQRVLVARALMSDPKLLLFDEPTSNIDPSGKLCLFELLTGLTRDLTVVMVSHDLISASAGITDVAMVNKTLIQGTEITPGMLQLVYGVHDSACPLDGYIKSLSSFFDSTEGDHA